MLFLIEVFGIRPNYQALQLKTRKPMALLSATFISQNTDLFNSAPQLRAAKIEKRKIYFIIS